MRHGRRTAACILVVGTAVLAGAPAALGAPASATAPSPPASVTDADDPGAVDVRTTAVVQDGDRLRWTVRTRGPWSSTRLRGGAGRRVCLSRSRLGREVHRACVVRRGDRLTMRRTEVGADGLPTRWRASSARVRRADLRSLEVTGPPAELVGLEAGHVRWYVTTAWRGSARCPDPAPCSDRAPTTGTAGYRIREAVPVGCVAAGPTLVRRGPTGRRQVALTYDDGPFPLTPAFLDTLRRLRAPATFFVLGALASRDPALLRRMVREGHAIGNHTWNHASAAAGDLGPIMATGAAVRGAVGFAPCLFRPPGGARSALLDRRIASLGMLDVLWNVDTMDYRLPGAAAIAARAGAAPAGSIVLMHDGGGPRAGTLAALPRIVARLRSRGLELVTVPELLGLRARWQYR